MPKLSTRQHLNMIQSEEQAHVNTLKMLTSSIGNISNALKDLNTLNEQLRTQALLTMQHCDPDFLEWLTEAIDGDFPLCETAESLAVIFDEFQDLFEEYRIEYSEEARKYHLKEMQNG